MKLISGYVPAQELNLPCTAVQEVAEECLLETPEGWLGGRFNDTWLPVPYAAALHYRETPHFVLAPQSVPPGYTVASCPCWSGRGPMCTCPLRRCS